VIAAGASKWAETTGQGGIAKPSTALWVAAIGGAVLLSGLVVAVVVSEPKKLPARRYRRA
jgi:hypothetical protein